MTAEVLNFDAATRRLRPAGVYTANVWRRNMRKRAADLTVPEPEGWEPPPLRYA
jgi:hypothetical protein